MIKEMSDMISDKHWVKWPLTSYLKKSYKGNFLVKFKQRKFSHWIGDIIYIIWITRGTHPK